MHLIVQQKSCESYIYIYYEQENYISFLNAPLWDLFFHFKYSIQTSKQSFSGHFHIRLQKKIYIFSAKGYFRIFSIIRNINISFNILNPSFGFKLNPNNFQGQEQIYQDTADFTSQIIMCFYEANDIFSQANDIFSHRSEDILTCSFHSRFKHWYYVQWLKCVLNLLAALPSSNWFVYMLKRKRVQLKRSRTTPL